MTKKIILIAIIVCIILYLIPNVIYICHFSKNGISHDPAIWGQYGDFIGGSINPILTILNIVALVYLTYTVAHIDDNRAKESINAQKIITITQMRHQAVSELSKELSSFIIIQDKNHAISILENITGYLLFFDQHNQYLFKELFANGFDEKYLNPLLNCVNEIKEILKRNDKESSEECIMKYLELEQSLISELNKFILKEMSPLKLS